MWLLKISSNLWRVLRQTQNKLNQVESFEFGVQAGSIRQSWTQPKDKADKTLVVSNRKYVEEFSKMKVGRNLWIKSRQLDYNWKITWKPRHRSKECYRLENNSTLTFNLEPFSSRLYQKCFAALGSSTRNVVKVKFWNVFNC